MTDEAGDEGAVDGDARGGRDEDRAEGERGEPDQRASAAGCRATEAETGEADTAAEHADQTDEGRGGDGGCGRQVGPAVIELLRLRVAEADRCEEDRDERPADGPRPGAAGADGGEASRYVCIRHVRIMEYIRIPVKPSHTQLLRDAEPDLATCNNCARTQLLRDAEVGFRRG